MSTTFHTARNNVRSKLAAAYTAGSGTLTVATGDGSKFGSPSPSVPIRITVVKAASANSINEGAANLTIFSCTGRSGDVLTVTAIEGSTDRNYAINDVAEARCTAGSITDLNTAVNSAEANIATNTSNIATNTSNIATLTTAVASKASDASVVHLSGNETIAGIKTFSSTIVGSVSGNAGTVTNGVYTTGTYADPSWLTSLAGSKVTGNIAGNAANVTGTVAVANGGTGTSTPGLVAGSNVTITGTWPNQTIAAAATSPGGSTGQLQWGNAGAFAGVASSSVDSSGRIGLAGGTPASGYWLWGTCSASTGGITMLTSANDSHIAFRLVDQFGSTKFSIGGNGQIVSATANRLQWNGGHLVGTTNIANARNAASIFGNNSATPSMYVASTTSSKRTAEIYFGSPDSVAINNTTDQGLIQSSWVDSTSGSTKGRVTFAASDYNAAREGFRIDADGSQALIGFYGATAVAKAASPGTASGTDAAVINAIVTILRNLGLCS